MEREDGRRFLRLVTLTPSPSNHTPWSQKKRRTCSLSPTQFSSQLRISKRIGLPLLLLSEGTEKINWDFLGAFFPFMVYMSGKGNTGIAKQGMEIPGTLTRGSSIRRSERPTRSSASSDRARLPVDKISGYLVKMGRAGDHKSCHHSCFWNSALLWRRVWYRRPFLILGDTLMNRKQFSKEESDPHES